MKTVSVKINIPDGWELACDHMRAPEPGESYLSRCGTSVTAALSSKCYMPAVIVKREWVPEIGKVYAFWSQDRIKPVFAVLEDIYHDSEMKYVADGLNWVSCRPLTKEEIGE